jgi:hypothetical protein
MFSLIKFSFFCDELIKSKQMFFAWHNLICSSPPASNSGQSFKYRHTRKKWRALSVGLKAIALAITVRTFRLFSGAKQNPTSN